MIVPSDKDGREETAAERLDRNTIELLNELLVAGGVGPIAVGVPAAVGIFVVWFGVPLVRKAQGRAEPHPTAGDERAPGPRGAPPTG